MSMLFRSVWRNVLHVSSLSSSTLRTRSLSSCVSVTEATRIHSTDVIMTRIKSAPSSAELLAAVQAHLPTMTHKHMLVAFRCLFELQKGSNTTTEKVIKDPAFGVLCQNFKKVARALDVNEAIEATKVLSFLGVPVDSLIVQTLLQIIRCNINMLNSRQIMFMDFILSRYDAKNHLVDALKLAFPLAFQIQLPLELDRQDLPLLRDMLMYCCSHDVPDRCINNVVTALLLHDQVIDAPMAKLIIWALCLVNCSDERYPTRVQLLHICYDILAGNIGQLTYDEVLRTAAKIKGRVLEKHPEYYHEQLMDAIAGYVVDNNVDFEKGLLVARVLSRIAHTHLGLIQYLCSLAASNPTCLSNARTNILFGFINCLSNNNFTPEPDQWEEIRNQITKNPVLEATTSALPWAKVCLELASLGLYEDKLLERVFSKEFISDYLARENNVLDYLQLFTLHEAVKAFHSKKYELPAEVVSRAREVYPTHPQSGQLAKYLALGAGGPRCVASSVQLSSGVLADLVICIKNGYPVTLPKIEPRPLKLPIEELNLPSDCFTICILNFNQGCFSMNSNRLRGTFRLILDTLEKQGYAAVAVNVNEWLSAPPHERTPYLLREINYKCGEMGMKLAAT